LDEVLLLVPPEACVEYGLHLVLELALDYDRGGWVLGSVLYSGFYIGFCKGDVKNGVNVINRGKI
jgi:hypothetical protein